MPCRSRTYQRTFTGCWRCRERKVKCDRFEPFCTPCRKAGLVCSGYQRNLVWVSADQRKYRHNGRRFLEPYQTWKNQPVLSSDELDGLISGCDIGCQGQAHLTSCLPFSAFRAFLESSRVDARIPGICVATESEDACGGAIPIVGNGISVENSRENSAQDFSSFCDIPQDQSLESAPAAGLIGLSIPLLIRAENRITSTQASLFSVYLNAVTPTLVPVHGAQNPWLRYPAIALHSSFQEGRNHLLHALLAHAAFFLGHTGYDKDTMFALGSKYYSSAMAELRAYLREGSTDYIGLLTTVLTFLLIELSRGSTQSWRHHLQAAWSFLQHQQKSKTWLHSSDAWYVTQSFHLLKTGADSTGFIDGNAAQNTEAHDNSDVLAQEVMCNPGYGWTMGTSSSVIETIADINTCAKQLEASDADGYLATIPLRLTRTLMRYQREVFALSTRLDYLVQDPEHLHLQAFQAATVIYYYQVCDDTTPRQLSYLVTTVLDLLSAFFEVCGGSFTLWPVCVAAAEAYREDDQAKFVTLLERVARTGRNMSNYMILLRHIWDVRRSRAAVEGRGIADTRVDWREVMRELEMDLLLL
ncbi:fungal-specific transcription factor domain-containing protein [Exophiala viscosa]|uniref:fungal-specific transcription factor domain-containing protein n=1 Tax=Exophiala viscosa TaxID=2486360 RepID=UPI00219ADDE5|nr:fungal-specific transcription factor domain-containing protein [Exophiala viscosa]